MILAILSLIFLILALYASGHALLNKRDPRSALGWVACCLLVPYAGIILYLLFGINRTHKAARKLRPAIESGTRKFRQKETELTRRYPLSVVGYNITHKDLSQLTDLQILYNGDEAYPAMLEAISRAEQRIYLSTYLFNRGQIAEQFISALKAASERGVDVKILVDGMGEALSQPRIGRLLRKAGLRFLRFNALSLLPLSLNINLRNHRKILIVDSVTGFTGGMNLADENCLGLEHHRDKVQDLHFMMQGPIVRDLENCFLQDWHYTFRQADSTEDAGPAPDNTEPEKITTPDAESAAFGRVITDGPNVDIDKFSDTLIGVISSARKRIWIMTPYFLPDAEITGALQAASLKNIDVRVILPSDNNIPIAHRASRHHLWQLLNYDVRVYYQQPPFSHSKILLIDDEYSLIGTANIDPRSLRLNYELNVELLCSKSNRALSEYCEDKMAGAELYTTSKLRKRDIVTRLLDAFCWLFTPYL